MTRKLNWQAFTAHERNKAIDELKSIVSSSGGYIIDSNFFSDLALSLIIETEESDILELYSKLKESMTISESGFESLDDSSDNQWWVFLNVTFSQGKGNLSIETPDVPG